jgi:hypothetical protein
LRFCLREIDVGDHGDRDGGVCNELS